jgi:hypothetical protein
MRPPDRRRSVKAVEIECRIEAERERVFEVFADLEHADQVVPGIERIEVLTPGAVGKGTRWRETRIMFGRAATEEMWIESFDPPHSYSVAAESHGARYHTAYTFEPAGSHGEATLVRMTFTATPTSLAAKVMGTLLGGAMLGSIRKAFASDMDALKAACERESARTVAA